VSVPANGHAFVALLVGGNADVLKTLRGDLYDEFGIEIRNQWETSRAFCDVPPRGTEVVLILTDFCAHNMSRDAVKIAKSHRLRYALIGRKKSAWLNGLNLCGFVHKPSWLKPHGPKKEIVMTPTAPPKSPVVPMQAAPNGVQANAPAKTSFFVNVNLPRYIPRPRAWNEADMQALIRLAEAWKGQPTVEAGREFVLSLWRESTQYRTPAVTRLRLDSMRVFAKVSSDLLLALTRAAQDVHKQRVAYLKTEAATVKSKARAEWPEYLSVPVVKPLVGKLGRISELKTWFDRVYGITVYKRSEIVAYIEEMESRGKAPQWSGPGMTPFEWERKILAVLKERGPSHASTIHIDHAPRGMQAMHDLIRRGMVIQETYLKRPCYRLPEHAWPPPKRRRATPTTNVVVNVAPDDPGKLANAVQAAVMKIAPKGAASDVIAARAEVYRALKAGEITARDAAGMIKELT